MFALEKKLSNQTVQALLNDTFITPNCKLSWEVCSTTRKTIFPILLRSPAIRHWHKIQKFTSEPASPFLLIDGYMQKYMKHATWLVKKITQTTNPQQICSRSW